MGMAASQARLLSLTARTHDVEFEAQSIQNSKLQLSTQQDEVYQDYLRALDAVTLTFASTDLNGTSSTLTATFNTLFSEMAAPTATGNHYALITERNLVVVSDEIYEGYTDFEDTQFTQSAYNFAMFMLYGDGFQEALTGQQGGNSPAAQFLGQMLSEINNLITGEDPEDGQLQEILADLFGDSIIGTGLGSDQLSQLLLSGGDETAQTILAQFFNRHGGAFFNEIDYPNEDVSRFNYYMRMFNVIQEHGGCISIDDFNETTNDNAANNAEWLTAMIQSGHLSIEQIHVDSHGNVTTSGVGVDSDQNMKYSNNTEIDKRALAKAEADYEHAMKVIDRKDKKYDLELKRLETERNALTKEHDSLKKVIEDNIDKSFGIFS